MPRRGLPDLEDEPSTLMQQRRPAPGEELAAPEQTFVVTVASGARKGATIALGGAEAPRVVVGTSHTCELVLPDRQVSRRHVSLTLGEGVLTLEDLQSKNGSFVGGVRVSQAPLVGGENITIGETVLRVDRGVRAPHAVTAPEPFGRLVVQSREMRRLVPLLRRVADTQVPVIIQGETGTGKEVVAETIHLEGPRHDGPFVVFDPSAVPASQIEMELFGHVAGAFTGGGGARQGVFEQAGGGTILIDEIDQLEPSLQMALLRTIDRGEIRPIGSPTAVRVDVRILAAARRDLDTEVQRGRFREDLFHRLAVARLELPPLRRRKDDIPALVEQLVAELGAQPARVPHALVERWLELPWPGNVRELRNAIARQIALGELSEVAGAPSQSSSGGAMTERGAVDGAGWLDRILDEKLPLIEARERALAVFERRYIERMLELTDGNVARAAAHAGIARRYFQILKAKRGI